MGEVAVLIPTRYRADKLEPLLANIAATTGPHRVYLIAEYTDLETVDTLKHLKGDHVCVFGDFGSCAKAMNAGYRASTEPFVFTGNDDLWFHDGWDTAALAEMGETTHIVGTNDGHDRMTCFAMARRSFIEERSGVFDQPSTLFYDEYASQYVDTEFADYAKARGVWGEAPGSITEHLHHDFGKADPSHPNYVKAQETCMSDHATYQQRRAQWAAHLTSV